MGGFEGTLDTVWLSATTFLYVYHSYI